MRSSKPAYDKDERQNIVDYIVEHNLYFELHGKSAWQRLERNNVCPGRTWQSMKQHFRTVIINSLDTLDLVADERLRIFNCFNRRNGKRELENYNDEKLGGVSKKSRLNNETITLTKEKHVTKNQIETNKHTVEEVQNENQRKNIITNQSKETVVPKKKNVTHGQMKSDNRLEEMRVRQKMSEKKINNNDELSNGTSSKNIYRQKINTTDQKKNHITDIVTSSNSKLNVGSKSSGRIHEQQKNNATKEKQNWSEIIEIDDSEEEPDPPVEEFSEEEDINIIKYIKDNMDWSTIKFKDSLFESCKNALKNHSALSIKNRFFNVIVPKLREYDVLEINDICLFYDRAGLDLPEEILQIMMNSEESEDSLSQDEDKMDNQINISELISSIDDENLEENEENASGNETNENFSEQTTIKYNAPSGENRSNNENKETNCDFKDLPLTGNYDILPGSEPDLKPQNSIFYGEYLEDQLCFNIKNEKHVFILESIVDDDYDLLIKELTDKYSVLNTNIHKVDAEHLETLTQIKTLNEEIDRKIIELAREQFKYKRIALPKTELLKSLGVPSVAEIMKKYNVSHLLPLPRKAYHNRNKNRDKNLNLNDTDIDLNTGINNIDTFPNNLSVSSHSSPIISMTKRRSIETYQNKNNEMCIKIHEELNLQKSINIICKEFNGHKIFPHMEDDFGSINYECAAISYSCANIETENDNRWEKINIETNIPELLNKTNHNLSEPDISNLSAPELFSPISNINENNNPKLFESEDLSIIQTREHSSSSQMIYHQQEIVLPNECNSEDIPLSQIRVKLIEEINALQISELKENNIHEQSKDAEELNISDISAPEFSLVSFSNNNENNNSKLFESEDLSIRQTREDSPSSANIYHQQEIVLPCNEGNSKDEPLAQIRVKLIEEINAPQISELKEDNNVHEQCKDAEELDISDLSARELFSTVSNNENNNSKLFESEDLPIRQTEHSPSSENNHQQEIVLSYNEGNSKAEPLAQIRVKLIEEINAAQISELNEDNNIYEQSKGTEEICQSNKVQSSVLNVMKQNMLLSKKYKQVIEKKNKDASLQ